MRKKFILLYYTHFCTRYSCHNERN